MNSDLYSMPVSFAFEHPTGALNKAMEADGKKLFIYSMSCDPSGINPLGEDAGWVYANSGDDARKKFGEKAKSLKSLESYEEIVKRKNLK